MGWRIEIQADDIDELLGEGRVVRELEVPPAVRAEAVGFPDPLYRLGGNTGRFGHRAQRPVRRLVRSRLLRQAGRSRRHDQARLVVKQAIEALMHEPLLPAPHAGLGLRGLGHDRRGAPDPRRSGGR